MPQSCHSDLQNVPRNRHNTKGLSSKACDSKRKIKVHSGRRCGEIINMLWARLATLMCLAPPSPALRGTEAGGGAWAVVRGGAEPRANGLGAAPGLWRSSRRPPRRGSEAGPPERPARPRAPRWKAMKRRKADSCGARPCLRHCSSEAAVGEPFALEQRLRHLGGSPLSWKDASEKSRRDPASRPRLAASARPSQLARLRPSQGHRIQPGTTWQETFEIRVPPNATGKPWRRWC